MVAKCEPNPGHHIVTKVQRERPATRIVTQNIDGMHQRAGAKGRRRRAPRRASGASAATAKAPYSEDKSVPMNPRQCTCGAFYRPDIVWFEDQLNPSASSSRAEACLEACDLLVSVGTSAVVYPAAQLPASRCHEAQSPSRSTSKTPPSVHLYKYRLRGKASEMPALCWTREASAHPRGSPSPFPPSLRRPNASPCSGSRPSSNRGQPAFYVPESLVADGLPTSIPVPVYYPDVTTILGRPVYRRAHRRTATDRHGRRLWAIERPRARIIPDILAAKPKSVWLQQGHPRRCLRRSVSPRRASPSYRIAV